MQNSLTNIVNGHGLENALKSVKYIDFRLFFYRNKINKKSGISKEASYFAEAVCKDSSPSYYCKYIAEDLKIECDAWLLVMGIYLNYR